MPPRPIDDREVYGKTLHAQRMADGEHAGLEKRYTIHQQLITEDLERKHKDQISIHDDRPPARRTEPDAHREKRERRDDEDDEEGKDGGQDGEEESEGGGGLRKRLNSDDKGKGSQLDVKG